LGFLGTWFLIVYTTRSGYGKQLKVMSLRVAVWTATALVLLMGVLLFEYYNVSSMVATIVGYWFNRLNSIVGPAGFFIGGFVLLLIICGVANWKEKRPQFGHGNYRPKTNKFGKLPY